MGSAGRCEARRTARRTRLKMSSILASRRAHLAQQVLGVQAVAARAVRGDVARRRGVGEQGADGRVHLAQALAGLEVGAEGVVAAGIEDDDVHRVAGLAEAVEQGADVDRLARHVVRAVESGVDRHEEVAPAQLQAVAGEIEQADGLALRQAARRSCGWRPPWRPCSLSSCGITEKPSLLQVVADGAGVVGRVLQRRILVAAVADHQGHARQGVQGRGGGTEDLGGAQRQ